MFIISNYISDYYESYDEDGRLKSRLGQVEFLTTMRYINRYLDDGMKVLDVGAGTGVYSFAIAEKGVQVDAVDLIQHNIDKFKAKISDMENVTIRQGNALDLSFIGNSQYDITLLFGPMYHLFSEEDKLKAISEAIRVTKPNGLIYISYCISDASIVEYGFKEGNIFELVKRGVLDPETFNTHSDPSIVFELIRKEDIDKLMSAFNTERLHYVATDGFTRHIRETIENMDDKTYEMYLKYHFAICEKEDMVGITHHSLDIVRRV